MVKFVNIEISKWLLLILVFVSVFLFVFPKPTKRYRYDAEFLDSEIQRIRSGRAEQIEPDWTAKSTKPPKVIEHETDNEGDDDEEGSTTNEDYYTSSEEIDVTCAVGKGWHIRGQRCVPVNCPGGPAERDFNTGECLYSHQPRGRFNKPFQQWNDLNHVYRSSPMSSHFVRSMIMMRKG